MSKHEINENVLRAAVDHLNTLYTRPYLYLDAKDILREYFTKLNESNDESSK